MQRIVVGVDGSENSRCALRWAIAEARTRNATLDVVHAWHMPYLGPSPYAPADVVDPVLFEGEGRYALTHALEAEDTEGVEVHEVLVPDRPSAALIDAAKGADLLVVGARGRGGFLGLLLGSVSHQVVSHAPCPVVVVPGEGHRDDR
ncbi:MAG: universal stress protein [Actinomycetota bacterium]|nr:universal stress protein [Actinomycetota bacterium]